MMNDIVKEAYTWLDTPHINGAKVKGKGVDCGMLLIGCMEGAGIIEENAIKIPPYSNEWHLHHSEEWFKHYVEQYCDLVTEMQEGDFLLYQYGRCCSHGAIYMGNGIVCHAVVDKGVILSNIDDVQFLDSKGKSRLRGIYRVRR